MAHQHHHEETTDADRQREALVTDDPNKPKIDWMGQIRYTLLMLVAIVAVLLIMRYLGLRG